MFQVTKEWSDAKFVLDPAAFKHYVDFFNTMEPENIADLVIAGLAGLMPREDNAVQVHPLIPPDAWDWFCLDGVPYHGRTLTILWDRTGSRYGKGTGLLVFADGRKITGSDTLGSVTGELP